ncbi:MAG TPA: hypothetical protein VHD34_07920 [Xanthobacteraceae bacterium]|nr:hypothetical protein [Xanthobacteraceae bacterium]
MLADRDDQQATGRLSQVEITVEAYQLTETAFILSLASPACLQGESEYDKVDDTKRIHVFSMDGKIRRKLRANVGKTIRVTGAPFGEYTAHHHAPIVLNVMRVESVR